MERTVNDGFVEFLSRLTPTPAERAASSKHRESVKSALEANLNVGRFFESGSFSHGTGVRRYSDVDVFVSIHNEKPASSNTALTWVKEILSDRFPGTSVIIDRPAVKVKFATGVETWEVIPAFLRTSGAAGTLVYDIPKPGTTSEWIDSAPDKHLDYVTECNKKPNAGNAKALARLLKAWKYYCNVPVSSFYLEMRSASHVASLKSYIHVFDVCYVLEALNSNQLAAMNDPMGVSGRFQACSSDSKRLDALSKLNTAASRARKALDAYREGKNIEAFYQLNLLFGNQFPPRIY